MGFELGEPVEIFNEDGLLAHLMEKYKLGRFAKVSQISTVKISPDIDLLAINEIDKFVTGYEFKLLRYHKGWNKVNFTPVYTGIGQTFLYLQHGVNRSYLVLGLSSSIPDNDVASAIIKIEETVKSLRMLRNIPTGYRYLGQEKSVATYGFDCIGIMLWNPNNNSLETKLKAERDYLALRYVEDLRHMNKCLLKKQFKYDEQFLENRKDRIRKRYQKGSR